jgi:hypothetical protein
MFNNLSGSGVVRAGLAFVLVVGGLVLFGLYRLTFDQLIALDAPVVALYFGQYVVPGSPPSTPAAQVKRTK